MRRRKIRAASQAYRYGLGFDILSVSYHNVYIFSAHCCGNMSENRKETVVIIGGGIIGLTTAYELIKKFNVHLVEKR